VIAAIAGERVAIVDSATATASALVELLAINGLEAPGTTGHERSAEFTAAPVHVQLTTGDVDAFRVVAERIFGEAFPDVGSVDVAAVPAVPTAPAAAAVPARSPEAIR
jgi:glutamate racemase